MANRSTAILLATLILCAGGAEAGDTATYRQWIVEMKDAPRGPFERLRWFCKDGSVYPPQPYACKDHGGGYQHGEWSEQTRQLRREGYEVANLLAGIDAEKMASAPDFNDTFAQILIERYLVGADDGWILRKALFYRGAIQEEDEREGGRDLLVELAGRPQWIGTRYAALRIGAQLLPHGAETASAQKVRRESAALSDKDPGFAPLRAKIHGSPAPEDAQRVREYAASVNDPELKARYEALAAMVDAVYQGKPLAQALEDYAAEFSGGPWLQEILRKSAAALQADGSAAGRFRTTASLLAQLRESLGKVRSPSARLKVLDASLLIERENFRASTELAGSLTGMTRAQQIGLLEASVDAAYGTGTINLRECEALKAGLGELQPPAAPLGTYLDQLRYAARVPGWGTQNLRFFFFESMQKLAEIEPKAMLFIQDQLRGSPLFFFSKVLDGLLRDGNRLAGVRHKVFGKEVGVGFQALNPGIAVGVLHGEPAAGELENLDPDGIYLLPETVSDLPPIAGILTAGEGNPLSHVQLLARNLGIPNVAVQEALVGKLRPMIGRKVVMAVSPAGLVELAAFDDPWARSLGRAGSVGDVVIRPDLEKLDLSARDPIDLDDLRAADSGRTVGPKAAKLGELRHAFPDAVARGVAIPFGIFKEEVLERPYDEGDGSVFDWMTERYGALASLPAGSADRKAQTEAFRAELYQRILDTKPSAEFRNNLRAAMEKTFGSANLGVFVRSDTNVEDLPGFTGAGLNLTLPNVVGFDEVMRAISRVWASPFTARAFAWRQSLMKDPQHVYTSVLLLESVASDKSGVLVTQDLDTGDRAVLSVAVNEGVGGAVDGQAAESLRIDTRTGAVRVMATATAPWRRRPAARGGIEKLAASGADSVLQPGEIQQLVQFAREGLPQRFPPITDAEGRPAAADVEFGFVDGRLRLFQIRPFLENRGARANAILVDMDRSLSAGMNASVQLNEVPKP